MANEQSTESYSSSLENESFILTSTEVIDAIGLECGICKESFELNVRPAKLLPCSHSFCLPCLRELGKSAGSFGNMSCASCRVSIRPDAIKSLPNDHRVVRGLEAISKAKARFRNTCFKHGFQPLKYFCKKCAVPLCTDCSVLCHREADGHVIVDLVEELKASSSQLHDREKVCEANLMKMKMRYETMTNIEQNLNETLSQEKNKIEKHFDSYNELLAKRKADLISMIENKVAKRKSTIDNEALQLQKRMKLLKNWSDNSKCARESNDVREIFKTEKKPTLQENDANDDDENPVDSLCVTCKFDPCHETSFMAELNRIGDVKDKVDFRLQRRDEGDSVT